MYRRSFAFLFSVLFALLLSSVRENQCARCRSRLSHLLAAAHTAKQKCINTCRARYRGCLRLELSAMRPSVGVYYRDCTRYTCTGCRTRMTDMPMASPERRSPEIRRASFGRHSSSRLRDRWPHRLRGVHHLYVKSLGDMSRRDPPPQSRWVGREAAIEMDMFYRLVTAFIVSDCGSRSLHVQPLGFTGQADASTRLTSASPSLTILAQNEENSQIQNELDPAVRQWRPWRPPAATPDEPGQTGGQIRMQHPERDEDDSNKSTGRGQVAQGGRRDGVDCFGGHHILPPFHLGRELINQRLISSGW